MKSCGLGFVSWKAVCTAVEASVGVGEGKNPSRGQVRARPRGHGRSRLEGLEAREEVADLPEAQQKCPRCGRPLDPFPGTDDAQVVEIETRVWRRVIRRRRYRPSCTCGVLPGIVTAPSPARLIARGKLGISVWVKGILDKYLYSRPSNRLLQELADQGLRRSPGTIAGGLRQRLPLLEPVREAIRSRQLSEDRLAGGRDRLASVRGGGGQGRVRAGIFGCSDPLRRCCSPCPPAVRPRCRRRTSQRMRPASC